KGAGCAWRIRPLGEDGGPRSLTCPARARLAGSSPGAPRSAEGVAVQPARYRWLQLVSLLVTVVGVGDSRSAEVRECPVGASRSDATTPPFIPTADASLAVPRASV